MRYIEHMENLIEAVMKTEEVKEAVRFYEQLNKQDRKAVKHIVAKHVALVVGTVLYRRAEHPITGKALNVTDPNLEVIYYKYKSTSETVCYHDIWIQIEKELDGLIDEK